MGIWTIGEGVSGGRGGHLSLLRQRGADPTES